MNQGDSLGRLLQAAQAVLERRLQALRQEKPKTSLEASSARQRVANTAPADCDKAGG